MDAAPGPPPGVVARRIEAEARDAYGRLVALLALRSGDLAGAEDALGDALLAALRRWPIDGVPEEPQAWLLTVARRRRIDETRRRVRAEAALVDLGRALDRTPYGAPTTDVFPDVRLALMTACAHPAIDAAARTPLMLQAVLGLGAERMASAFLTSPAALAKRLVRAKAKLATAGVRFELPGTDALATRLAPVLDAIYAAFTLGRDVGAGSDLAEEARWLARVVADLAPDEPEALGLLSLLSFVTARPAAPGRAFVPLIRQDPANWDAALIGEAERLLRRAGDMRRPGRFQLEAAIQAVHADRRRSGRTDWAAILTLYDGVLAVAPRVGAHVGRAAALARSGDAKAALRALDALDPDHVAAYQPYWATRAHALAAVGQTADAADAYRRAAGLTRQPAVRAWLLACRAELVP